MPQSSVRQRIARLFLRRGRSHTLDKPAVVTVPGNVQHVQRPKSRSSLREGFQPNVAAGQRYVSKKLQTSKDYVSSPEYQLVSRRRRSLSQALPQGVLERRCSADLQNLTLSDEAGQRPYCEDVADRNISGRRTPRDNVRKLQARDIRHLRPSRIARESPYRPPGSNGEEIPTQLHSRAHSPGHRLSCLDVNNAPESPSFQDVPAALQLKLGGTVVVKRSAVFGLITTKEERRRSLTHKPNIFDLRNSSLIGIFANPTQPPARARTASDVSKQSSIKRSRLEQPLPPTPVEAAAYSVRPTRELCDELRHLGNSALGRVHLTGTSGHQKTEDTTFYERWAPTVTHDTITQDIHEIREEHIHKEIYRYDVYHRIQPVVDYEILPPRHFVPVEGGYEEVAAEDLPAGTPNSQWIMEEVASQLSQQVDQTVPREEPTLDVKPRSCYSPPASDTYFERTSKIHRPTRTILDFEGPGMHPYVSGAEVRAAADTDTTPLDGGTTTTLDMACIAVVGQGHATRGDPGRLYASTAL
ncbi:hypothetical protein LTR37_003309 [Vermiconidia calcicola]|uniref:Uncharacterized protein n=1 Tax=Vermiconidia calcicola TaxID=1690605 RepID=A0ACC3NSN3_9PEZI|nr:hypothetical protein LTR37_003309 [Vermiconidia calcicola]